MAARQSGKVTAPVKQKLRKNHGPKRHLFKEFKPMVHIFAATGILSKYYNYESFVQACGARGVRTALPEMWMDYSVLPTIQEKKDYLADLKARNADTLAKIAERAKAAAKLNAKKNNK